MGLFEPLERDVQRIRNAMGGSASHQPRSRIEGMTEHEMIRALCAGRITPAEIYTAFGDCPLSRSVVGEYEGYKTACENPELYWQERIDNLEVQLRALQGKKLRREPPPMPYGL